MQATKRTKKTLSPLLKSLKCKILVQTAHMHRIRLTPQINHAATANIVSNTKSKFFSIACRATNNGPLAAYHIFQLYTIQYFISYFKHLEQIVFNRNDNIFVFM